MHINCNCCQLSKRLTVEGQVSEEGGQQVHDEHGQEGHVGNALHLSAGTAVRAREQGMFDLDTRAVLNWNMRQTLEFKAVGWGNDSRAHSLFELLIHGQDGRVAHEGEGQDGNGVHGLEKKNRVINWKLPPKYHAGFLFRHKLKTPLSPESWRQSTSACRRPRCSPRLWCSVGAGRRWALRWTSCSECWRLQAEGTGSGTSWWSPGGQDIRFLVQLAKAC